MSSRTTFLSASGVEESGLPTTDWLLPTRGPTRSAAGVVGRHPRGRRVTPSRPPSPAEDRRVSTQLTMLSSRDLTDCYGLTLFPSMGYLAQAPGPIRLTTPGPEARSTPGTTTEQLDTFFISFALILSSIQTHHSFYACKYKRCSHPTASLLNLTVTLLGAG
jgi:hypothetical protein